MASVTLFTETTPSFLIIPLTSGLAVAMEGLRGDHASLHLNEGVDVAEFAHRLRGLADDLEASLLPVVVAQATEIVNGLAEVDCG